jgi:hypothetical protein
MESIGDKISKANIEKRKQLTPEEIKEKKKILEENIIAYLKFNVSAMPGKIDKLIEKIKPFSNDKEAGKVMGEYQYSFNKVFGQLLYFHIGLKELDENHYLLKILDDFLAIDNIKPFSHIGLMREEIIKNLIEFKDIILSKKLDELG